MKRADKRRKLLAPSEDQAERLARIGQGLSQPAETPKEKRPTGRPRGKRSNPDYQPVTTYLKKKNYVAAQNAVYGTGEDFGDLVDRLLEQWLRARESANPPA
jgi:hypothetical protein